MEVFGHNNNNNNKEFKSIYAPKPKRISIFNQICPQKEISDSQAMSELLDIILANGDKSTNQVSMSPPFFCGSPPKRVSNPLIEDSRFGCCDGANPLSPAVTLGISPSSSGRRGGGSCAHVKYGNKPAAVRIEGFNCLSRDRRSVFAVA